MKNTTITFTPEQLTTMTKALVAYHRQNFRDFDTNNFESERTIAEENMFDCYQILRKPEMNYDVTYSNHINGKV